MNRVKLLLKTDENILIEEKLRRNLNIEKKIKNEKIKKKFFFFFFFFIYLNINLSQRFF